MAAYNALLVKGYDHENPEDEHKFHSERTRLELALDMTARGIRCVLDDGGTFRLMDRKRSLPVGE